MPTDLFSELNELMVRYRFRPNRKLAQLFIIDEEAIKKVIEAAHLEKKDTVLEIGAGTGFVTRELQKHCNAVAVELDDNLYELLWKELPKENLELLHGNFLEIKVPKFNKVVSFPPYTVSSDILYKLFDCGFETAVLVFQSEFAERVCAEPGFFDYNALSVLTQYFCDVEILGKISAKSFFPQPSANSAIMRLKWKKRKKTVKDIEGFKKFVKCIFRFQNKNLKNALQLSFQFLQKDLKSSKKEFEEKISDLDMAEVKVKLLFCDELVDVFNEFQKK